MNEKIGDGPVDQTYVSMMKVIAETIDEMFNGPRGSRKRTGFILMVFPFGDKGRANYMSNANRADVIVMLKEQLARFEGSPDVTGRG